MLFGAAAATSNDGAVALLKDLGLSEVHLSTQLKTLASSNSRYLKDVKLNVATALNAEALGKKDAYLLALAVAVNEKHSLLHEAFENLAKDHGATDADIAEVISCTSLMSANNIYYRFRHFMHEEFYDKAPAGIRMSIMANPAIGKELFELVSLVVSAVNGCEMCVTSHEKNLVNHGTDKQRIHDAVRLGAVIRSLTVLL
jgi:lipoyl-dependent peroxiredoxin subunit D